MGTEMDKPLNDVPRSLTYPASKTLAKKLLLPERERWCVQPKDVYTEGKLVVYIKKKGFFCNSYSDVKTRPVTLTRRGYLVIYMKGIKGYILDVASATSIECITDRPGMSIYLRTHIKLRYEFGNVHLWGFFEDGLNWKTAMQNAFARSIPRTQSSPTVPAKKASLPPTPTVREKMPTTASSIVEIIEEPPTEAIASEYAASDLRSVVQKESAVSWAGLTEVVEEGESFIEENSPVKQLLPLNFQDVATDVPSVTSMQRVRRFLSKTKGFSLPSRHVSAPDVLTSVPESTRSPATPPKQADDGHSGKSMMPKETVADLRAKLERTFSNRPPVHEKKGLYRWLNQVKKTTSSPEKKAKLEIKESMTTMEYKKACGMGGPVLGTESETNV